MSAGARRMRTGSAVRSLAARVQSHGTAPGRAMAGTGKWRRRVAPLAEAWRPWMETRGRIYSAARVTGCRLPVACGAWSMTTGTSKRHHARLSPGEMPPALATGNWQPAT